MCNYSYAPKVQGMRPKSIHVLQKYYTRQLATSNGIHIFIFIYVECGRVSVDIIIKPLLFVNIITTVYNK